LREGYRPSLSAPRDGMDEQQRTLTALAEVLPAEAFLPGRKKKP
jgi:hypothetical protein